MKNILLDTIKEVLNDVHIESGRKDEFDKVCEELERAILVKIMNHEIDCYTEHLDA